MERTCPRPVAADHDRCVFHLTPEERSAASVTSSALRAAFLADVDADDPSRHSLSMEVMSAVSRSGTSPSTGRRSDCRPNRRPVCWFVVDRSNGVCRSATPVFTAAWNSLPVAFASGWTSIASRLQGGHTSQTSRSAGHSSCRRRPRPPAIRTALLLRIRLGVVLRSCSASRPGLRDLWV